MEEVGEDEEEEPDKDSDKESEIDEKYLETGSSETEKSEDEDSEVTGEIIRRFGQDRERPRLEVRKSTFLSSCTSLFKSLSP